MWERPIETLWEAHSARKRLWVFCRNCGKATLIKPFSVIRRTRNSDSTKLWEVSKRFACRGCGLHEAILIVAEGIAHKEPNPDYRTR